MSTHNQKKILPLLIVGSGPCENLCKQIIAKHNYRTSLSLKLEYRLPIIFKKETENPYTFILNATAVFLCSKSEGFSNVALESLYANTPLLLSMNKGNMFLLEFNNFQKQLPLVQLLPLLNSKKNLSAWASSMHHYAHFNATSTSGLRAQVIKKCSAEVNIFKWIKVIESI
jgi:hypothetical protein